MKLVYGGFLLGDQAKSEFDSRNAAVGPQSLGAVGAGRVNRTKDDFGIGRLVVRAALSLSAFAAIVMISSANLSAAQTGDPVAPFRTQREAVVEGFRIGGSSIPLASSLRRGAWRRSPRTPAGRRAPEP